MGLNRGCEAKLQVGRSRGWVLEDQMRMYASSCSLECYRDLKDWISSHLKNHLTGLWRYSTRFHRGRVVPHLCCFKLWLPTLPILYSLYLSLSWLDQTSSSIPFSIGLTPCKAFKTISSSASGWRVGKAFEISGSRPAALVLLFTIGWEVEAIGFEEEFGLAFWFWNMNNKDRIEVVVLVCQEESASGKANRCQSCQKLVKSAKVAIPLPLELPKSCLSFRGKVLARRICAQLTRSQIPFSILWGFFFFSLVVITFFALTRRSFDSLLLRLATFFLNLFISTLYHYSEGFVEIKWTRALQDENWESEVNIKPLDDIKANPRLSFLLSILLETMLCYETKLLNTLICYWWRCRWECREHGPLFLRL